MTEPRKKNRAAVALGKLSGQVWTDAKRAASRENGKRGGRPREDGRPPQRKPAPVTDAQIETLCIEAGAAGDQAQVRWCRIALDEGASPYRPRAIQAARSQCARVIADAAAQVTQ